jgi:hypothetical protein
MDSLASLPWKSKSPGPVIEKGEKLLLETRHHWMKHIVPIGVFVILAPLCVALFPIALSLRTESVQLSAIIFFGTLISLLLIHHWFFHAMLSENVTDIILTNRRVFYMSHQLWFADTMDEVVLQSIKIVEAGRRGIVRRLFNYGELWFDIGGGGQKIPYVPSPQTWATYIERMRT